MKKRASVSTLICVLIAGFGVVLEEPAGATPAPTGPPAGTQLCNGGADSPELTGPSTAPPGSVTVPAGNNGSLALRTNTTYYLASGTHTLGTSEFGQWQPASGDTFIGAAGCRHQRPEHQRLGVRPDCVERDHRVLDHRELRRAERADGREPQRRSELDHRVRLHHPQRRRRGRRR